MIARGPEVEAAHEVRGRGLVAGAERVDLDRDRLGDADRVGDLDLEPPCEAGVHDLARHEAAEVGAAAVDLRRVLAAEGAAAVARGAAVACRR